MGVIDMSQGERKSLVETEDYLVWRNTGKVERRRYNCGFCGGNSNPDQGYFAKGSSNRKAFIFICPTCSLPTLLDDMEGQVPAPIMGGNIQGITDDGIQSLYNEARSITSVGAYTATVLLCRKILMNIAVQKGANEGESFISYVEYLDQKGYIPPDGKAWVDKIREKGNIVNHEIILMEQAEAKLILDFVGMLLIFIYEFPKRLEADEIGNQENF